MATQEVELERFVGRLDGTVNSKKPTLIRVNIASMRFAETNSDLIQGFWFEIRAGEIVAMLGPSGIGKTTLLRILSLIHI